MKAASSRWSYILRESFLLLAFSYVLLLAGGFAGLLSFRVQILSTILVTAIVGGWLILKLFRRSAIPWTGIDWAIGLFLLSQFIAVAFSEDPRRSLPHAILWLVFILVFYFTLDLLRSGLPQAALFRCLLIIGAVLLVASALDLGQLYLQWRQLTAGLELFPSFQQRIRTIVGDPNLLAAIINLLIPIALATLFLTRDKVVKAVLVFYLIVSMVVLYFTDSRGGLLGFGSSVGVFIILWISLVSQPAKKWVEYWAKWFWKRRLLLMVVVILLIGIVGFVGGRFISFQGSTTHAPALEARTVFWQAATNALIADPLTGAGPGIYPIYLMKLWSTPPEQPFLHAHSFPFTVAAESGLLGLAATALLIFVLVRRVWKLWFPLDYQARTRWVAAIAALAGVSAHSLVDNFFPFTSVGITVFVLLAVVLNPVLIKEKVSTISTWWLILPGLIAAAFTIYFLNGYFHADKAIEIGRQGNWEQAAREMQIASQADPGLAWYWLQTGYAYGRAADTDPYFIDGGISAYEKGIAIEPQYSVSHANLAALLWQGGVPYEALRQMRIATSLAPESWLMHLNEGVIEEALSHTHEATSSYSLAINFKPDLVSSVFWTRSELRNEAPLIAAETTIPEDPRKEAAGLVETAQLKIENSDFDSAHFMLIQARELFDQNVSLYARLGELAFAEGDLGLAEKYVQVALWIQATDNQAKVEAILLGAEISIARGDHTQALQRYEIAYNAILAEPIYGWGSSDWPPYAWFVFQHESFPDDLLPQLERADIPVSIAQRLLPLADLYEGVGDSEKANEVRLALQPYLP